MSMSTSIHSAAAVLPELGIVESLELEGVDVILFYASIHSESVLIYQDEISLDPHGSLAEGVLMCVVM